MKSRKLIGVYTGLLIIAVATMIMLWRLKTMPKAEVFPRDYPEIKEEGILRLVTEYNQSGYYVAGDTIEGFQYELSQAIAQLSGLEIQIFLEMSLAESFDMQLRCRCPQYPDHQRDQREISVHRTDRPRQASPDTTDGSGQ